LIKIELHFRDFRLDLVRQLLYYRDSQVPVHPMELRLLSYIALKNGEPVTTKELGCEVIGHKWTRRSNTVAVQMHRLREHLRFYGESDLIESNRSNTTFLGYSFNGKVKLITAGVQVA